MKSALFLLLGSALLSSCAVVQSASCRKAAQGDIPCQGLKGLDFQNCQVGVRRAVTTCQTEQMHGNPDSVGVYRLPPPEPTRAQPVIVPQPVAPVVVPEEMDSAMVEPLPAKPVSVATPTAPKATRVDPVAKVEPTIDSSASPAVETPNVEETPVKPAEGSPTPEVAMPDSTDTSPALDVENVDSATFAPPPPESIPTDSAPATESAPVDSPPISPATDSDENIDASNFK